MPSSQHRSVLTNMTWVSELSLALVLCSFAYIEFSERDAVGTAMTLDNTLFRGRVIKVSRKPSGDWNNAVLMTLNKSIVLDLNGKWKSLTWRHKWSKCRLEEMVDFMYLKHCGAQNSCVNSIGEWCLWSCERLESGKQDLIAFNDYNVGFRLSLIHLLSRYCSLFRKGCQEATHDY